MAPPSGRRDGVEDERAALGQIADLREIVLEVGRRAVGGNRIRVRVQLVEHETVRIALVLPEMEGSKNPLVLRSAL
ncbi:hypothetical protein ABDK75_15020 [Gluconobacter sp. OJA]